MPTPTIDPDIARAHTLPSRTYHAQDVYDAIRERVFARSWQPVGNVAQLKAPGHVIPLTLLDGCLNEPLVLTRDGGGRAHCLSNVCTHRGTVVVEGEAHCQTLRCRYHGRRFALDGRMKSMPEFDDVEDFPSPKDDLPNVPLKEWGPLFFASLDSAWPFEDWIGPIRRRVEWMGPGDFRLDPARSRNYLLEANWALYCDNYLEGFHLPYVHGASLGGKLDYGSYRTELFDWCNVQIGVANEGEPAFDLPKGHPDAGERIGAWYFWLFPNVMLNFYPWGLSLNVVQPLSASRTRVLFRSYVGDAGKLNEGAGADLHRVEMEDEEIVESAQRGVRSRLYDRGRYSPSREQGPHHFHRLLSRFLIACLIALSMLVGAAEVAEAQRRGRAPPPSVAATWMPISVGMHGGYDDRSNGEVLGVHTRIPVLPNGLIELGGSGNITFLPGLREYHYNADLVIVPLQRRGGLYFGGGVAMRNSVFIIDPNAPVDPDSPRETKRGFGVVAGLKSPGTGRLGLQVEARWVFMDDLPYDPRVLAFGVNLSLWGGGRRGPPESPARAH